jgi:hypothetical protein
MEPVVVEEPEEELQAAEEATTLQEGVVEASLLEDVARISFEEVSEEDTISSKEAGQLPYKSGLTGRSWKRLSSLVLESSDWTSIPKTRRKSRSMVSSASTTDLTTGSLHATPSICKLSTAYITILLLRTIQSFRM